MKERIGYIDLAKGVCIILVVFYHASGMLGCSYWLSPFLNSFRLPLYFVLAGLFFRDYGSVKVFLLKKTNRLLVPFLAFYLAFSVIMPNLLHYALGVNFGTVVGWSSLWAFVWPGEYPNVPIWFLWCLFFMNVLFWSVRKVTMWLCAQHVGVVMFLQCCGLCVLGYYLQDVVDADVANLFQAMQSMPYFCLGYIINVAGALRKLGTVPVVNKWLLAIVMLLVTFVVSMYLSGISNYIAMVAGVTGTLMVVTFSSIFGRLPFVSYIGRYSIVLLLTHGLVLRVLTPLCHNLALVTTPDVAVGLTTAITLLAYLAIIPFSRRFIPQITAQSPLLKE